MSHGNSLYCEPIDSLDSEIQDSVQSPNKFINEIVFSDIELLGTVGRGAFGVVQKARWKNEIVAIKIIDNGGKEFFDEVSNLSSVQHKNIIKLYGTTFNKPKLCLVMEYAECGSLYNLLHPIDPTQEIIPYTFAHVMSWSLQCAEAVNYLHKMKPRGIVHRDLKPPNMLLTEFGTIIKICDFGTATAYHTEMTSNKGSASWMAPEVFEGTNYTEKCDVYSFGIVLWEMLTRRKPFDEIGPPAFRIMWAVHSGKRPPPIRNIPACLDNLMTSCWAKEEKNRPPFEQIVQFFKIANQYVEGGNEPLFEMFDPDDPGRVSDTDSWSDSGPKTSIEIKREDFGNEETRARLLSGGSSSSKGSDSAQVATPLVINTPSSQHPPSSSLLIMAEPLKDTTGGQPPQYHQEQRPPPQPIHGRSHSDLEVNINSWNPFTTPNSGYQRPPYNAYPYNSSTPSTAGSGGGFDTPPVYKPGIHYQDHKELSLNDSLRASSKSPSYFGLRSPNPLSSGHASAHTTPSPILEYPDRRLSGPMPRHEGREPSPIPIEKPINSDIDFRLVPQELMPVNPIESVPNSIQMYENHMESLKTYIDLQTKINIMRAKKEYIERNIEEVDKEQNRNSRFLEKYLELQNEKQSLLDLHRQIKTHLEKEKQRRATRNIPIVSP